jgi:hypothetical protein
MRLTAVRIARAAVGAQTADELAVLAVAALPAGFRALVAGPGARVPRQLEPPLQHLAVPVVVQPREVVVGEQPVLEHGHGYFPKKKEHGHGDHCPARPPAATRPVAARPAPPPLATATRPVLQSGCS